MNSKSAKQPIRRPGVASSRPASVQAVRAQSFERRIEDVRSGLHLATSPKTTGVAPQSSYACAAPSFWRVREVGRCVPTAPSLQAEGRGPCPKDVLPQSPNAADWGQSALPSAAHPRTLDLRQNDHSPAASRTCVSSAASTKKPASLRNLPISTRSEETAPVRLAAIKTPKRPMVGRPRIAADCLPSFSSIRTWSAESARARRSPSVSPASSPRSACGEGAEASSGTSLSQPSAMALRSASLAGACCRAVSSLATAGGMSTSLNCSRKRSSRPMIAKLESGEVSLTTSISKISVQFGLRVVAGDATAAKLAPEIEFRHSCQLRRPAQAQDITSIQSAGDLLQQVETSLRFGNRDGRHHIVGNVQSHAHGAFYPVSSSASTCAERPILPSHRSLFWRVLGVGRCVLRAPSLQATGQRQRAGDLRPQSPNAADWGQSALPSAALAIWRVRESRFPRPSSPSSSARLPESRGTALSHFLP